MREVGASVFGVREADEDEVPAEGRPQNMVGG